MQKYGCPLAEEEICRGYEVYKQANPTKTWQKQVSHSIYRSNMYHTNMKRVLVSLPKGIWEIIEKNVKGKLGEKESEVLRNIIIAYLSEKGYFEKEE